MEDDSTEYLSEISGVDEQKFNEKEKECLQKFLNILEIDDYKFKRSFLLKEACPLLFKDVATQTERGLISITPPWVAYIENKTNTICKELSDLLKSVGKPNECETSKKKGCTLHCNWIKEDCEEKYNVKTINQIEEKIEASLKMVLELKNIFSAQSLKEKGSQTSFPTINNTQSSTDTPKKDPVRNLSILRISPPATYMDDVFPMNRKNPQKPFEIFNDRDLKCSQRARAVVAPTRSVAGLANNPIERNRIYCSTPKNSVQIKRESLVTNRLQENLQKTHEPVLKGEPSRVAPKSATKKQRTQSNPQRPPWR